MKIHLDLITSTSDLNTLCDELNQHPIIAFDTEFIREKTYYPKLALIQCATRQEAWLVDPLAFSSEEIKPFLDILENENILKVLHSAYGDQECIYTAFGLTVHPTLDTYESASLLGYGESVSLRDLIHRFTKVKIPKFLTRTNWLKRPMNEEMRRYAMADVEHLVPIAEKMMEDLKTKNRLEWAKQLSRHFENPDLYQAKPDEMAERYAKSGRVTPKGYPIFKDLIRWRENRAQTLDIPRRRVADEDTLINIANSRPKTLDHLRKFRGINLGEIKKQGDILMDIIHHRRRTSETDLPRPPKITKPNAQQSRIIDFVSTALKAICQRHQIASRLILTVKEIQKIVVEDIKDPTNWPRLKLCSPQAASLVGEELVAVLKGEKGLGIVEDRLSLIELSEV
jgi:ribonuclease D